MPRVTRAQAEAAVERMRKSLCLEIGDQCNCWACMEAVCIYAYLAQRPDEDTVRKGHEALEKVEKVLNYEGVEKDWISERVPATRAAMYPLPKEEA